MSRKLTAALVLISYAAMVAVNYLAVSLPLNDKSTAAVSDRYQNFFTPAGFTFSIWGLIYTALLAMVILMAVSLANHGKNAAAYNNAAPWLILNFVANAAWLFAWHYEMLALSVGIMVVLLSSLIVLHLKFSLALPWKPVKEKMLVDFPISIYLGWISIATVANLAVWHESVGIVPFGIAAHVWAVIVAALATVIALLMLWSRGNVFYVLVIAWGLFGVASARGAEPGDESVMVASTIRICLYLLLLALLLRGGWKLMTRQPTKVKGVEH